MTLKTAIDLPAPQRVGGGLLNAARPLPDGWERGILFNGSTCLGPEAWPYCLSEESPGGNTKPQNALSDVAAFEPTGIVQGVECTTLSRDRAGSMAMEALLVTAEFQLGKELADGVETGNPNLLAASSTNAADAVAAMAAAEEAAASQLFARLAFFHVSPGFLVELVAADLVWRDGRSWRSPMGHTIVASPGYAGLLGQSIHITGEVFASLSVPESRADIDRAVNSSEAYAEQLGLAAFDPCVNIAVEVTS